MRYFGLFVNLEAQFPLERSCEIKEGGKQPQKEETKRMVVIDCHGIGFLIASHADWR